MCGILFSGMLQSSTYSDDGKSACGKHSNNDPLNICKHIIPNALREKEYNCLANLYASSCNDAVKRQALQTMKELLTRYTFTTDKEIGEQLVHIESVLRPKQDGPKDPTIVKLYLEVYHLVVTLLYIAVASGSISQQQVGDVLEHGQEASSALEALVSEQLQFHWADADQLNSHMYIIGKFLKEKLRAAVETPKYIDKLNVFLKRLNSLTDPRLTVDERSSRQRVIEPSITKCLPDKFHQHVVFHYLVILVSVQLVILVSVQLVILVSVQLVILVSVQLVILVSIQLVMLVSVQLVILVSVQLVILVSIQLVMLVSVQLVMLVSAQLVILVSVQLVILVSAQLVILVSAQLVILVSVQLVILVSVQLVILVSVQLVILVSV